MATGDRYERISPYDRLIVNDSGDVLGIQANSTGKDGRMLSEAQYNQVMSSVSGAGKSRSATRSWAAAMQPQASFANYTWQVRAELPVLPSKLIACRFAVLTHPTVDQTFVATMGSPAQWTGKNLTGGGSWQFAGVDGSDYNAFAPFVIKTKGQKYSDVVWSDWGTVPGSPRTDGGTWAIVVIRLYQQAGAAIQTVGNAVTDVPMTTLSYPNLRFLTDFQSGDFVSANRDTFAGASNPGCSPVVAIEYLTTDGALVYSVADFGDSIEVGWSTSIRGQGPVCDAASAINAASQFVVAPMMQGSAGEPVEAYLRRYDMWLKSGKGRPSICIFRPYSRNNGENVNRALSNMQQFLDLSARFDVTPILSTGMYETDTLSRNPSMLEVNAAVRAVCAARSVTLLELEDLWGVSSPPLADAIHPNDAGQALMVPRYTSAILAAIARRGA